MTVLAPPPSPHATDDLWVFGYGSLIWNPGFAFVEQTPARLVGAHRALCIYSMVHRGTPERPGLVLGLDRGGACQGVAFRVAASRREATIAYLRAREQVTRVYCEVMRPVVLDRDGGRRARALVYIADRRHPQYAGQLTLDQQLRLVRQGHGGAGPNAAYVLATVAALEDHGIRDARLHQLAALLCDDNVATSPASSV
ncbi:MAG: gamma-glutamylcyclotransferase [Xanthobacteraceae bacterium]